MDPNAALDDIRQLVLDINESLDGDVSALAAQLIENFSGLDSWLSHGGFLPSDWAR